MTSTMTPPMPNRLATSGNRQPSALPPPPPNPRPAALAGPILEITALRFVAQPHRALLFTLPNA